MRALRQRVQDRLVYPWMAARRGQQGVVELEVRVGAEGRLVGVEVVAGAERRSPPRGGGGGGAGRGAVPVPSGGRGAAARDPACPSSSGCAERWTPLRGRNSRFFFDPPGTWAIVDDAMAADVTAVLSGALLDALGRAGLPPWRPRTSPGRCPGIPPTGTTRPTSRCSSRKVSPARPAPGRGGDPRPPAGGGRDRARRGRGPWIPQRFPGSGVLPRRAARGSWPRASRSAPTPREPATGPWWSSSAPTRRGP